MDAALSDMQELSDTSCWGGHLSPHKLAEVLSLLLPVMPLDARARAACVCRAWRAATSHPALWEELDFEHCAVHVTNATPLASLCTRAGDALRTLRLELDACTHITSAGTLAALHNGGCTGLRRLNGSAAGGPWLTAGMAQQLVAACPLLNHTACAVHCCLSDAAALATVLPGPLKLTCSGNTWSMPPDVTQLAECLRVNATFTSLNLYGSRIGAACAAQLAECLRVNTTLTSLDLDRNGIGDAGATQLAECLHVNNTLTSLGLVANGIRAAGTTRLAECLRVNATLASLILDFNVIGDAGTTQLAECLRVNTTLTHLSLNKNGIGAAGATQLAECLRVNATLTSLDILWNNFGTEGLEALRAACPPQCTLLMPS